MRSFKRTLIAGAVALAVSAPAAAQFNPSNMYFFGDSSTDAGFYGSRFTVNPGLIWARNLGARLRVHDYHGRQGWHGLRAGRNECEFAVASRSRGRAGSAPFDPDRRAPENLADARFECALRRVGRIQRPVDERRRRSGGLITPAQVQANVALAGQQYVQQVARLGAAGAKYIVVFNLYDIGKSPFGVANPAAQFSSLVALYNTTINAGLGQIPFQTVRVNTQQLFLEMLANPSFFGFTNVSSPACTTPSSLMCTTATLVAPNADKTYLFSDDLHPTPAAEVIMAEVVNSMLTGPQQIGALGDAPFRVEDANFRALDGRMWSSLDAPRPTKKLEAWVAYDYGSIDMQAGPNNGSGYSNTVAIGGDMKLSDRALAGMMFGYTESKGDFGGDGGGFKLRQPVLTLYAGYGEGPWYLGATFGAGSLDYNDVNRNIVLGPSVRNESGQTRGYEYTGRVLGGYWFKYQDLLHGPYARVTYTKAIVRQFSETGSDSTALTYGQQDNDQLLWGVGWQIAGKLGGVRPWARATWEYDSLDNDRTVTASSNTLGGWYTVPAPKPDNSYALFNVGAAADFGGVTGYISGSGTAARGDGNYWAITVGLRMPL